MLDAQENLDGANAVKATSALADSLSFYFHNDLELIAALVWGDLPAVLAFVSGVPSEEAGLPTRLLHYLESFSEQFSGLFLCLTLLHSGLNPSAAPLADKEHIAFRNSDLNRS